MMTDTCAVPDCERLVSCKGFCAMHYVRWRKHGDPAAVARPGGKVRQSTSDRFWEKVDRSGGPDACWPWLASTTEHGYGQFGGGGKRGKRWLAHRFAYTEIVGPIPEGTELDHVKARGCVGPVCVNPAHLEPVTHQVNILRGDAPSAIHARQTHCNHGHPFDEANTYWWRGERHCRECRDAALRRRAERPAPTPPSHCAHGHPLDATNLYISNGSYRCRACLMEYKRAARRRAGVPARRPRR